MSCRLQGLLERRYPFTIGHLAQRWTLAALALNSPSRMLNNFPRCDLRAVTGF